MEVLTRRNHANPAKSNKILCLENLSSLRIGLEDLEDLFDLDDFFAKQFFDGSAHAQKSCNIVLPFIRQRLTLI
jgi:hypothetical protein